jgi:hypothetical protein
MSAETRLFCHLYQKCLSREITTFSSLVEYVRRLKVPLDPRGVLAQLFVLLKELHWGFFKDMDRSGYTRLWKELVLPHDEYPAAGDLKRNISISNIFVAMLDIHGYTRFCQESRANLSRLRKLDEFLHDGIKNIARKNSVLANRERGDEIVLVGATATNTLKTALEIINSFSRRSIIKDRAVERNRDDYSIILPDFKVTAGIAGGNLSAPLIITQSGLLSGFLLNTAARLQSRANELAPRESKILVTKNVYASFVKENRIAKSDLYAKNVVSFFNSGPVVFKGTKIYVYEAIFKKAEKYRLSYVKALEALYSSLDQGLWNHKIFVDLTDLISAGCAYAPPFSVQLKDAPGDAITNQSVKQLCAKAGQLFAKDEDYVSAVSTLIEISSQLEQIPAFDPLIRSYAAEVRDRYRLLIEPFEKLLEREIDNRIDQIFTEQFKIAYQNSKKSLASFTKLKHYALNSKALSQKKMIWNSIIESNKESLALEIYSGKK